MANGGRSGRALLIARAEGGRFAQLLTVTVFWVVELEDLPEPYLLAV